MPADILNPLYVLVDFGEAIPHEIQGPALLALEKDLRDRAQALTGARLHIEVFKRHKGDDSKLRAAMTPEQRAKL